ncbi:hypothetical protein ACSS6W_003104 [Trichoderma asperelloides]|nr:hypothetical protein LI328DRAFT_171488 [Trichoderma asperelloides]
MSAVDLVTTAIGTANLCLQHGQKLMKAYQDFKSADKQVNEKILHVQSIWARTEIQIEFVKQVAGALNREHCRIHLQIFDILMSKLSRAATKIEAVIKENYGVKKWKFPFVRDAIDEAILDLDQWQRIFDPTWYLILLIGDELIDKNLSITPSISQVSTIDSSQTEILSGDSPLVPAQRFRGSLGVEREKESRPKISINLSESGLDWDNAARVKYSSTYLIPRAASKKKFAVDTIICDQTLDITSARADAECLAKKLAQLDRRTAGLLNCFGFIKRKDAEGRKLASLHLVFSLPAEALEPKSLRHHFLHSKDFSLTTILNVARQLVSAVSYVHTCGWVHKNIRPDTILVFPQQKAADACALGPAYLLGFNSFRSVNFRTMRAGDDEWDRNLYRYPSRQGLLAQEDYIMQHDVYSLGVCLLELGLWESFVCCESDTGDQRGEKKRPSASLGLELDSFQSQEEGSVLSAKIKTRLVDLARTKLPSRMGDKYTSVVVTCLTCLDPGNKDFGDDEDMRDDDGILVGVRFIEKVLLKLEEIAL